MNRKQILVLEDLGIPKNIFEEQASKLGVDYEIVWKKSDADSAVVEILINVKKTVDATLISQFPNLKMIGVAFTGFDSIDLEACTQKGITVSNVPEYSTHSVAELTVGLSIALLREIPKGDSLVRENKWALHPGLDLNGKTVGILGTGKIGLATAKLFSAFNCSLVGWSRTENEEFKALGGKYIKDKEEFFAKADIVSVHVPYNQHTEGLIGKKELKAMKSTTFLINTARGPIVDEDALFEALKKGKIAGAALDVFSIEPLPDNHPFKKLENVILTPHVAYKTEEALERRAEVTLQNITAFINGNPENIVN